MITIEQLLESVDLEFEPRFVTRDGLGSVVLWKEKPTADKEIGVWNCCISETKMYFNLKLAEFDGKDWTECIYEVPRKVETTDKIEKLDGEFKAVLFPGLEVFCITSEAFSRLTSKINELVDTVNELKGAKNG